MNRNPTLWGLLACLAPGIGSYIVWPETGPALPVLSTVILIFVYGFYKRLSFDLNARTARAAEDATRRVLSLQKLNAWLRPEGRLPSTTSWSLSEDALLVYLQAIDELKPKAIIECGSGISTVWAALLIRHNNWSSCHVHALEADSDYARQTRSHLKRLGLSHLATVYDCPIIDTTANKTPCRWYNVEALPENLNAGVVLVDGPPSHNTDARWPAPVILQARLNPQCRLLLDDANRPGEFLVLQKWGENFPGAIVKNHEASRGLCEFNLIS